MLLHFYLILIRTNELSLSRSYGSQFAEFLYDCYLINAFVFSTSLPVAIFRYGCIIYLLIYLVYCKIKKYYYLFFQYIFYLKMSF